MNFSSGDSLARQIALADSQEDASMVGTQEILQLRTLLPAAK